MSEFKGIKTIGQLATRLKVDPDLEQQMKENPAEVIDQIVSWEMPNTTVYRIVVTSLGAAVLIALIGSILITLYLKEVNNIPDILVATASAAVGALAGLLAPQPGSN